MPRGGRREGAGGKFKWNHGKTKTIRVPEVLADKILDFAIQLDNDSLNLSTVDGIAVTEHETRSKVLNLAGISIRACNGKSAVYLEDLVKVGYEIRPERLGQIFKSLIGKGSGGLSV